MILNISNYKMLLIVINIIDTDIISAISNIAINNSLNISCSSNYCNSKIKAVTVILLKLSIINNIYNIKYNR